MEEFNIFTYVYNCFSFTRMDFLKYTLLQLKTSLLVVYSYLLQISMPFNISFDGINTNEELKLQLWKMQSFQLQQDSFHELKTLHGNGNWLQYSCLGNHMDRGAWWVYSPRGRKRFRHDLVTKQQQYYLISYHNYILQLLLIPFEIS